MTAIKDRVLQLRSAALASACGNEAIAKQTVEWLAADEITALRAEVEQLKGNEIIDDAEIKALRENLDTAVGLILRALRYGMNRSEYYNALKAADVGAEMAKFVEGK